MRPLEGIRMELKKQFVKDVLKTVVAFANTKGGKILLGVADDGEIVGVKNPDEELLKLTNSVRDGIKPDLAAFATGTVEMMEGKQVVVFEVQKGTSCPYYLAGKGIRPEGVYLRQGASSVPATDSAIIRMIRETHGESYEELRSLNQDLEFTTLSKVFQTAALPLGEMQMRTLGILDADGLFTNLGLLLSEQCPHTIKAAVFEGRNRAVFKDRYEFSGSVMKQLSEVLSFLDRYNRTRSTFEGIRRVDFREYPVDAIREAVMNAIVHKDYAYSGSTLIHVFDDRIELVTIGGLVKGVSKSDIMLGVSILRNKNLAAVFYRLKWIEAYGTGIHKIMEAYEDAAVKPVIEVSDNAFKIVLPNREVQGIEERIKPYFTEQEKRILLMFDRSEEIRRRDIEGELSISQAMAVKLLKRLLEKSAIIKLGEGKNTRYRLREQ